ncbi:glycoside hydrolase family 3 N-terminal domain-containing protein [Streptomyces sp. NPDC059629]|uniref:glycoside hydrolase family 3 N-terminal domain-containing protein n=1 Tax=Streptomyces sp. NPDC059629 TaxID=3346889 RepID=UPI0036ABBB99
MSRSIKWPGKWSSHKWRRAGRGGGEDGRTLAGDRSCSVPLRLRSPRTRQRTPRTRQPRSPRHRRTRTGPSSARCESRRGRPGRENIHRALTRPDPRGARFVMVSLVTYTRIDPAHQAAFSPTVIDGMLGKDLGSDSVVVSDDLGNAAAVQAVPPGQRALAFLRAGGDLIVTVNTGDVPAMTSAVLGAMLSDPALRTRVDASVRRVLAAKQAAGLVACQA